MQQHVPQRPNGRDFVSRPPAYRIIDHGAISTEGSFALTSGIREIALRPGARIVTTSGLTYIVAGDGSLRRGGHRRQHRPLSCQQAREAAIRDARLIQKLERADRRREARA